MKTNEYIKSRIKYMHIEDALLKKKLDTRKEMLELAKILDEDESLDYIITGCYLAHTWIISLTSRRIILLNKGITGKTNQIDIQLDKIDSTRSFKKLMFAEIVLIEESGTKYDITNIPKTEVDAFLRHLSSNVTRSKARTYGNGVHDRNIIEDSNNLIKLKELAGMNRDGIITDEEFEKIKNRLLNML